MRNIISKQFFFIGISFFFGMLAVLGQTSVGTNEVEGKDVLLDFKQDDDRGIILSWVSKDAEVISPVGGTLIFDSNDKKVKYYKAGSSAGWVDLSINAGKVDVGTQKSLTEIDTSTILGDASSSASGVLVLEATDKSMVLPKSNSPHLNIKSPAAGTIAYDKVSKMLCVFNGEEWSFWKVEE